MNEFQPDKYHDLIVKYLTQEASEEEMAVVEKWVQENEENKKVFTDYQELWNEIGRVEGKTSVDVEEDWKQVEARLDLPFLTEECPQEKIESRKAYPFLKIAAVLAFIVISALAVIYSTDFFSYEKVATSATATEELILADGTKVSMNASTVIRFPEKFENKEVRLVKLDGEAFFEVAHNEKKPFIIEVDKLLVRVVGTSFNIQAYEESNKVKVTVRTGKVAVYPKGKEAEQVLLTAGHVGVYSTENNSIVKQENHDVNFLAWKTKHLIFEDASLEEVVAQLNHVYHKKLVIKNEKLKSCPITVEFEGQSLEAVLNVLQSTLNLEIEKQGDVIELRGDGC